MPERTTTYSEDGLTYSVRIFEEDGQIFAEITVLEGFMDVNGVYYGDDEFSGDSADLGRALNMNGAGSRLDGERVQWDDAVALSNPGLGREGTDKSTFLQAGDEPLRVELNADSIDDIDIFGIRATSTSTPEGSIKAVSAVEDDDNGGDDEETYDKMFFVAGEGSHEWGTFEFGVSIFAEDNGSTSPNDVFLPEGSEGTLEDYVNRFLEVASEREGWDPDMVQSIRIYQTDENGNLVEVDGSPFLPGILNGDPLTSVPPEDEEGIINFTEDQDEDEDETVEDDDLVA